jgi:DNA-directed RNA polymerase subunit H (RpoH/RPB5)
MDSQIMLYYNARKTVLKMCEDRGYTVNSKLYSIGPMEFKTMYENSDLDISNNIIDGDRKVYIKFSTINTKVEELLRHCYNYYNDTHYNEEAFNNGDYRIILVLSEFEKSHEKDIEKYLLHKYVELHEVKKLSINPSLHKYQPKFKLLSEDETKEIYKKYNASPHTMGSICIDDPINKYYHGLIHQMYEIKRGGNGTPAGVFYRIVSPRRINIGDTQ